MLLIATAILNSRKYNILLIYYLLDYYLIILAHAGYCRNAPIKCSNGDEISI